MNNDSNKLVDIFDNDNVNDEEILEIDDNNNNNNNNNNNDFSILNHILKN